MVGCEEDGRLDGAEVLQAPYRKFDREPREGEDEALQFSDADPAKH